MDSSAQPPTDRGALAKREARLAWSMLFPTIAAVSIVVALPLLAIFWISFKPVSLEDLRPPETSVRESLRTRGEPLQVDYRIRNTSQDTIISSASFTDTIPDNIRIIGVLPKHCSLSNSNQLKCEFGDIQGGFRERFQIDVALVGDLEAAKLAVESSIPIAVGQADYILTNLEFSFENFARVFSASDFLEVLWATTFYTVFGTIGALVAGLFAAILLDNNFRGQGLLRGLFLFPYVAPVIAVAFTWVTLFDPFSGSANALLQQMGVADSPINFFGERPQALIMVTVFEIWRYFPLSFLFILARMQSIDSGMYEAADMDGASPFQKFWYLSLPQLLGILSVLFLLRFIWTFNKFDDIFLLTGGNAGTRTLTVSVYEQAFAISNIGAGAAVAVVVFFCLLVFSWFFFRFMSQEEGL